MAGLYGNARLGLESLSQIAYMRGLGKVHEQKKEDGTQPAPSPPIPCLYAVFHLPTSPHASRQLRLSKFRPLERVYCKRSRFAESLVAGQAGRNL